MQRHSEHKLPHDRVERHVLFNTAEKVRPWNKNITAGV